MQGGIIGFGYWGKILCKNLKDSKRILTVFDISKKALNTAKKEGFQTADSLDQILKSDQIKFLILPVPPSSQRELVKKGLEHNKHILVEKPFGSCLEDKTPLFKKAKRLNKVLMVDYSFLYSPGFQKLKKLMADSKMKSYESLRTNSQLPVWNAGLPEDLVIHDLSMLVEIIPSPSLYVSCQPLEIHSSKLFQTALISITGAKWRAFIYASRTFSAKKRLVLVKTSKRDIEFKEIEREHYVRLAGSEKYPEMPLKGKSSLEFMFEEFFNRIRGKNRGEDFTRHNKINSLLKALNISMHKNGEKIEVLS